MKLIKQTELLDAITEYKVSSMTSEHNSLSFMRGAEFTESLLLPKMVEFAEWCAANRRPLKWNDEVKYWAEVGVEWEMPQSTAQLLDIWIDSNKTPAAK